MIRIAVNDQALLGLRMTGSPLWEVLCSLSLLSRYRTEVPYPYGRWAAEHQPAILRERHHELFAWVTSLRPLRWPAFLAPSASSGVPSLEDELAALIGTPEETMTDQIRGLYPRESPAALTRFSASAGGGSRNFADLVRRYWEDALAPYWSTMRVVLEEEILFRGRTLATAGVDALLTGLGGQLRPRLGELAFPHQTDVEWTASGTQLVVVPVLFARGMRIFAAAAGSGTAISYQARGAGILSEVTRPAKAEDCAGDDRLTILLGRGRARILRALTSPTTTTAVAGALGLAPSTVSQHLTTFVSAEIVRRHRVGLRVLYELDDTGTALLRELDD